ncbi:hypothetical protein GOV11_01565 [Candidatus Woesearchaeota archaeon]|nr:hypothetical protein [Candidatus Woesearchaeota archaeon]
MESTKMSKDELHEKMTKAIEAIAADVDKNIAVDVLLISEFWQSCYDGKYELLQLVTVSAPVYDSGMLGAIKIAEIHKNMILKKFEKYIACYVLAGSIVRGKATPDSDIDVFVVIDDTDVKKMSRVELKDKLRAIINDMTIQAGQMTGIQNKLSIQVYILTDFWDNMKEANPIIFTFLRDGVPFYDRGVFMPWKQLLKMGKIRPSHEAIELYKSTGDQMLDRIRFKLKDIAVEDIWYATITPSQAAIMLYGHPPPVPREIPSVMRDLFVKKEKVFKEEHIKFLEKVIKIHKDVEYGKIKNITGTQVQELLEKAELFLKALSELYNKIDTRKEEESIQHIYEAVVTVIRDVLKIEGVEKVSDAKTVEYFEKEVVHKGVIPERYLRILKEVHKAKKDYDQGKLTKAEVAEVQKNSRELLKFLVEHVQRVRSKELERVKLRIKRGEKVGEVLFLGKDAFITRDISQENPEILTAKISKDGALEKLQDSSLEKFEHALAKDRVPQKIAVTQQLVSSLHEIFGGDVEILLN